MKKAVLHSVRISLLLAGAVPLAELICLFTDYRLLPASPSGVAAFLALPSIVTVVLSLLTKEWPEESGTLVALMLPLSLVNAGIALLGWESIPAAVGAMVAMGCGLLLTVLHTRPLAFMIVIFALTAHVGGGLFFAGMMGNFGKIQVVRSIPSPDGSCWVEVVSHDQGALGGDTLVKVCGKESSWNGVVFRLNQTPDVIYVGQWWEYKTIQVAWKNDHCLIINGQSIAIN